MLCCCLQPVPARLWVAAWTASGSALLAAGVGEGFWDTAPRACATLLALDTVSAFDAGGAVKALGQGPCYMSWHSMRPAHLMRGTVNALSGAAIDMRLHATCLCRSVCWGMYGCACCCPATCTCGGNKNAAAGGGALAARPLQVQNSMQATGLLPAIATCTADHLHVTPACLLQSKMACHLLMQTSSPAGLKLCPVPAADHRRAGPRHAAGVSGAAGRLCQEQVWRGHPLAEEDRGGH